MRYDSAQKHFKSAAYPAELPIECAYFPIGAFIGWAIECELTSEDFEDEQGVGMLRFMRKDIGCTILAQLCDGKLEENMFVPKAIPFVEYYYLNGIYFEDLKSTFSELPSMYHIPDEKRSFEKIYEVISDRFIAWNALHRD